MSEPVKRRRYRSTLRAEQAAATRARILAAARELFADAGYPRTTLGDVAVAAGVASDTVLHVFGSKKALLRAVLDVVVGGDDADLPVLERDEPQAMRRETDQRRQIEMFASGMTGQLERIRPLDDILRSAAVVDTDARELREDLQLRQRRAAMMTIASWIAANGDLADGLTVGDAADIIWTMTSPEVHQLLREYSGWDVEKYQRWLQITLEQSLLNGSSLLQGS
ncbi:MAG TPA: helix-turn-helix domain-containing protein [Candidatus Nanopelagicales bacterium]|jgi:AcrR family transcriptional regulator